MASVISFRPDLRTDSVAQRTLRIFGSEPVNNLQAPKPAVMAFLTANGSVNNELLNKAHRAAHEYGGEFFAVLVDPRRSRFVKAQVRTLVDEAVLASYLGAKIIWLESSDVVGELLRRARESNVGRIFVARSRPAPFFRPLGRSVYSDLLNRGDGIRIDVVGFERGN